jgi:type II secretory pathway pseudopilin PulG
VVKFFSNYRRGQSGLVLIETLVALAIMSLVGLALLSGLITSSKATMTAREQAIAESLARSQLEYIKSLGYLSTYAIDPSIIMANGWAIPSSVVELVHDTDDGIQKITITPEYYGKQVLSISMYKVNR